LFSEIVQTGTSSIRANAGLIKKVAFRREIIPIAFSIVAFINFLISCSVVVLGFALTGNWPQLERLPFAIPAVLIIFIFGTGLALILSAFNVVARDTKFIVDLMMMLTMWMSSIFYAWHNVKYSLESRGVPDWAVSIFLNNPITASIISWRQAMWPQATEAAERASREISEGVSNPHVYDLFDSWHSPVLIAALWFSICFFWFAQRVFNRLQANFASEL
jgi:ABC-2 type transport system permease protein